MIRLTELRLPLDHPPEALRAAIAERLGVAEAGLARVEIFRRGHDARKRGDIRLVYTVDVAIDGAALVPGHLAYLDPGLPSVLLPAHWPGTAAAAIFREYYAALDAKSQRYFNLCCLQA